MGELESYFNEFRKNIIGIDETFESPYGRMPVVYADWIASGRLYKPIEARIIEEVGPWVANTHSESSETGTVMTHAYHLAHKIIKEHVNAGPADVIITAGFGMTAVINKLQRILGLKVPEQLKEGYLANGFPSERIDKLGSFKRPIVFVTHMEHHSNHTSWLETIADVVVIEPDKHLRVNTQKLEDLLEKYKDRELKIGAFSACSNVTGLFTPYHKLAGIMHRAGGICFIDFAASAPYKDIDMHPSDAPDEYLDGVVFSPHKFLGGPGSSGVLIFNSKLYHNKVPDNPGGGTVLWTNRWNNHNYITDIEAREDGGTPGFIQSMRTAMAIGLKNRMDVGKMQLREEELLKIAFTRMEKIEGLHILAGEHKERIGVISFYIDNIHHNLIIRILNDRYGIQIRGGCSCAGTYGHFLLHVTRAQSKHITEQINDGDLSLKPGWARLSLHPTMTDAELEYVMDAIEEFSTNVEEWKKDYNYSSTTNEFVHKNFTVKKPEDFRSWFSFENNSVK
jgi:selenocysteine lyase/cysteine desulfurase